MRGLTAFPHTFFMVIAMAKKKKKEEDDLIELDDSEEMDWIAMAEDSIRPEYDANAS